MPKLDEYGYPLPVVNPATTLAPDEFGIAPGMPGYDPNATGRGILEQATRGVAPGLITVAGQGPEPLPQGWTQGAWNQDTGQLRQDLKLDELRTRAAANKLALQEAEQQGPLKTRLLEAQLGMTGAHERFLQSHDAQVLEHTANFLNHLSNPNAPSPNDPGYRNYLIKGLLANPRFAETAGGQTMLGKLAGVDQTHASIEELKKQLPPGFEAETIEVAPGKQSHITAKRIGSQTAKELKNDYGLTKGMLEVPGAVVIGNYDPATKQFKQDNSGAHVAVTKPDGTQVLMTTDKYEKFGGKYSPETAAARTQSATAPTINTPVQVKSVEEANALPAGTTFLTPDGKLKRKP